MNDRPIDIARKIREELRAIKESIGLLCLDFQKRIKAEREPDQTSKAKEHAKLEVTANVRLSESVEIHKNAADTTNDRNYQTRTLVVAILTLAAIVGYSILVFMQLNEMIKATGAAERSVDEARLNRIQAQKAFDSTVKQFHLDQRAWFGISESEILQYNLDDAKKPFRMNVWFKNSGKTPARQIKLLGTFRFYKHKADGSMADGPTEEDWKVFLGYFKKDPQSYVIAPNATRRILIDGSTDTSENNYIMQNTPAVKRRDIFLYYFGQAIYLDVDNRQHITKFCLMLSNPDSNQLYFCSKGNEMD